MKAFKFSLQSPLHVRSAREKACQGRLAAEQRVFQAAEGDLQALRSKREKDVEQIVRKKKGAQEGWVLSLEATHLHLLDKTINESETSLNKLAETVEKKREELASAMREKKILENLEKKEKRKYLIEQNILERKQLDSAAASAFLRKMRTV